MRTTTLTKHSISLADSEAVRLASASKLIAQTLLCCSPALSMPACIVCCCAVHCYLLVRQGGLRALLVVLQSSLEAPDALKPCLHLMTQLSMMSDIAAASLVDTVRSAGLSALSVACRATSPVIHDQHTGLTAADTCMVQARTNLRNTAAAPIYLSKKDQPSIYNCQRH